MTLDGIKIGSRWKYIAPTMTKFYTSGEVYTVRSLPDPNDGNAFLMDDNEAQGEAANHNWLPAQFVQEFVPADEKPVHVETVTRMVIVPGEYGIVNVGSQGYAGRVAVALGRDGHRPYDAAELRAAARVFVSLAEALEQPQ